jgi:putative membrane protein
MQILRTILWIVITAILVAFIAMNWGRAPVNIWPLEDGYLFFEWPVGIIALVFYLLGVVPVWLLYRAGRWRLLRRISNLENSVRAASAVQPTLPANSAASTNATPEADTAPAPPAALSDGTTA